MDVRDTLNPKTVPSFLRGSQQMVYNMVFNFPAGLVAAEKLHLYFLLVDILFSSEGLCS